MKTNLLKKIIFILTLLLSVGCASMNETLYNAKHNCNSLFTQQGLKLDMNEKIKMEYIRCQTQMAHAEKNQSVANVLWASLWISITTAWLSVITTMIGL